MHEQPSTSRLSPGLIAMLVILAAVAGTMGYLVARQVLAGDATPPTNAQPGGGASAAEQTPATTPDAGQSASSPAQTEGPDQSQPDDGESCPKLTKDAVTAAGLNGELTLRIYVEFSLENGPARAWICENADGVLIYQAHERFGAFDRADNARNTILLAKGIKGEVVAIAGGFRATNPSPDGGVTAYTVTLTAFTLDTPSGDPIVARVIRAIAPA